MPVVASLGLLEIGPALSEKRNTNMKLTLMKSQLVNLSQDKEILPNDQMLPNELTPQAAGGNSTVPPMLTNDENCPIGYWSIQFCL
jgi:hypothetical protein